jgi:hypothetical protein
MLEKKELERQFDNKRRGYGGINGKGEKETFPGEEGDTENTARARTSY